MTSQFRNVNTYDIVCSNIINTTVGAIMSLKIALRQLFHLSYSFGAKL